MLLTSDIIAIGKHLLNYIFQELMMSKARKVDHDQNNDEPKIYGVNIDPDKGKIFNRRDFIKAATAVGATIALTGCNQMDEEEMLEALEQTLQAREKEDESDETKDKEAEPQEPTATDTQEPTNTPTHTPTEEPTNTETPQPKGEVTTSHSMFKGPQVNHPFIKKTTLGEEVTILGRTEDGIWFKIMDEDGVIGWCYAEFITVLTSVSIPTIYNIPTPVPEPCDCDTYEAPCSCDGYGCTCDTVHYWYPN
jgi:hypothetical protein